MMRRTVQLVAVAAGALTYVIAAYMRIELVHYFRAYLAGHWIGSIDALLIYTTTLLSGFVAGLLYREQVLLTGFCAGAVGELARGVIKPLVAMHAVGWAAIVSLPLGYVLDILFAALVTGILGAAGAAVSVVARRDRPVDRSSTRS
jgi:hypothetical protein